MVPRFWAVLTLCSLSMFPVDTSEYRQRRAKVRDHLSKEKGILVLYGATEAERGDIRSRFFQEANFYYLTGWTEPGARLLLTPADEFLFLPPRNEAREIYTGRKLAPGDPNSTGLANVLNTNRFEVTLFQNLEAAEKIFSLLNINIRPRLNASPALALSKAPRPSFSLFAKSSHPPNSLSSRRQPTFP